MVVKDTVNATNWAEVSAKAQAHEALYRAGLGEATIAEKANFLKALGLTRGADIAGLIGSTEESVRKSLEAAAKKTKATGKIDGD